MSRSCRLARSTCFGKRRNMCWLWWKSELFRYYVVLSHIFTKVKACETWSSHSRDVEDLTCPGITPYGLICSYQNFGCDCCGKLQGSLIAGVPSGNPEDWSNNLFRNVGCYEGFSISEVQQPIKLSCNCNIHIHIPCDTTFLLLLSNATCFDRKRSSSGRSSTES